MCGRAKRVAAELSMPQQAGSSTDYETAPQQMHISYRFWVFSCGCSNVLRWLAPNVQTNHLQKWQTICEVRGGAVCVPRAAWPPSALQNQDVFAPQLLPLQHMESRMGGSERSAAA